MLLSLELIALDLTLPYLQIWCMLNKDFKTEVFVHSDLAQQKGMNLV